MMRKKLIYLFLLTLPLLSFTKHKFYVSVTHVNYVEKQDAFQITTRIFIDDLEALLLERYDIKAGLATPEELSAADDYIEKYLRTKLLFRFNGEIQKYAFLGKRYDNDVIICYLEITQVNLPELQSLEVQNEILTDLFEEQQNLVHLNISGKKKSFVLIKENNKGMLNL
ncbi:hypothetical protein LVD13_00685 [Flavobacteriaceae bacterium D16]|nr:hypothetical protein [Flavobacteriaceae bacterium D16]